MSLVSTASPWTNDDTGNKKRQSTMRKTIKIKPANSGYDDYSSTGENNQGEYMNLEELQQLNEDTIHYVLEYED